jgi:hypothetical protein
MAGTLSGEDHAELLRLAEQEEAANVERVRALIVLAGLRGTDLAALLEELGAPPPAAG